MRISLLEKGIPFDLDMEVPWDSTTATPQHNPLEKLPVLIPQDGAPTPPAPLDPAVYESSLIMEYLELVHPTPALRPAGAMQQLAAKQVEVVADSACDAMVLYFFETLRDEQRRSPEWMARQLRKVQGAMRWFAERVDKAGADGATRFLVGDAFGLADIAAGACLGYSNVRFAGIVPWQDTYPHLATYWRNLEKRESFAKTVPAPQSFVDKVV